MMLLRQAWRNLFRNTRRTLLTGSLISLGLAALMGFDALILGMSDRMVASSTFLGQAYLQHRDFAVTRDVEKTIGNLPEAIRILGSDPDVTGWAPRIATVGMIASADTSLPLVIYGMEAAAERKISKLDKAVARGKYLDALGVGEILLGEAAARKLRVELGDKVVLTATRADDGELAQSVFRVGGLIHTGIEEFDKGTVALPLPQAQTLLGLEGRVHEIALGFQSAQVAANPKLPLWEKLRRDDNLPRAWPELIPELASIIDMMDRSLGIMALILGAAVSVGVLNTLSMSIFERSWEFGVMQAIGTRKAQVISLVVLEATCLALASAAIGVILATILNAVLSRSGFDISGAEFGGAAIHGLIHPHIRLVQYTVLPVGTVVFTALVALYPAWKASRASPARAMAQAQM